jgi:DNA-binding response OmpR family regulator
MRLLLLTSLPGPAADALPSLELLTHQVRVLPPDGAALLDAPPHEALVVDGTRSLPQARSLCRLIRTTGATAPLILVATEGGLSALQHDWGMDDVLLNTAGPAEIEARLRLAVARARSVADRQEPHGDEIRRGDLVIDEGAYLARIGERALDLTFKEFELLKFLAQHPGRVFTRAQLLQEVWGYDYYGGTRTVDVHVRRLRAKLGLEYDGLVGTVRNVGYRFVPPRADLPGIADDLEEPVPAEQRRRS